MLPTRRWYVLWVPQYTIGLNTFCLYLLNSLKSFFIARRVMPTRHAFIGVGNVSSAFLILWHISELLRKSVHHKNWIENLGHHRRRRTQRVSSRMLCVFAQWITSILWSSVWRCQIFASQINAWLILDAFACVNGDCKINKKLMCLNFVNERLRNSKKHKHKYWKYTNPLKYNIFNRDNRQTIVVYTQNVMTRERNKLDSSHCSFSDLKPPEQCLTISRIVGWLAARLKLPKGSSRLKLSKDDLRFAELKMYANGKG